MEYENAHENTRGIAIGGLTTGVIGTALSVLNGGLGNVLGGSRMECAEDHFINRYELGMQNTITNKDMEIAYLKGRDAAKSDSLELYRYIDGKFASVEHELCEQKVYNATANAAISCLQNQVNQLAGLTKVVIPNTSVCPGWGNVTVAPATTTTG